MLEAALDGEVRSQLCSEPRSPLCSQVWSCWLGSPLCGQLYSQLRGAHGGARLEDRRGGQLAVKLAVAGKLGWTCTSSL